MDLDGQAALVTGGSRGIGRAIALDLAKNGADVAITYVEHTAQAEAVAEAIRAFGRRAEAIRADVADGDTAQRTVERVAEAFGRLDILVNNAGIMSNNPIWDMHQDQWEQVVRVNLTGVFNYIRAVAPLFKQQGHGKIVNIASIHGLRGREEGPNYSAAKAGVIGLTKSVARDLGPFGVNVNCVAPGTMDTGLAQTVPAEVREAFRAQTALGRLGQPEDVAYLTTFLCSNLARHITGEIIKVDGGQYI